MLFERQSSLVSITSLIGTMLAWRDGGSISYSPVHVMSQLDNVNPISEHNLYLTLYVSSSGGV